MFERLEILKLVINILFITPVVAVLFYRRFDVYFLFVGSWWLFGFFFGVLHYLAVSYYPIEYIANPILMVAFVAAITANAGTVFLILPQIINKTK